ncbi:MAG: DUF1440 domain-containing protein [Cyclobacteriaceae bacterium]
MKRQKIRSIVLTGIVAGTLDGLAAVLMYFISTGKDPLNMFQFIASGIFGMDAFAGSVPMAIAGLLFHYPIAIGWTWLFFVTYQRLALLSRNTIILGIGYGIFIWLMMNLVVVPLSKVPSMPISTQGAATGILILILCVGLPVSILTGRYYRNKE